jgi:hypothetical protein
MTQQTIINNNRKLMMGLAEVVDTWVAALEIVLISMTPPSD